MKQILATLLLSSIAVLSLADNTFRFNIPQPSSIEEYTESGDDGGSIEGPGFGGGSETGSGADLSDVSQIVVKVNGYHDDDGASRAVINELSFNETYTTTDNDFTGSVYNEWIGTAYTCGDCWSRVGLNDGNSTYDRDYAALFIEGKFLVTFDTNTALNYIELSVGSDGTHGGRVPTAIDFYKVEGTYDKTTNLVNEENLTLIHTFTFAHDGGAKRTVSVNL